MHYKDMVISVKLIFGPNSGFSLPGPVSLAAGSLADFFRILRQAELRKKCSHKAAD
jgi:hypothetical protein